MILKRKVCEEITMCDLFKKLEVSDQENAALAVPFPLEVKTPYGPKKIVTAFRTEKQSSVTTYFRNNSTLKTSPEHRIKVNGEWKKIKDVSEDDVVETETGTTSVLRKHVGKEEILYDISVEEVNCYYSNGILSHNSWLLCTLGARAMKSGKNIAHFTLELNENYVGLRYDCCFTGIDFQQIKHKQPEVEKVVKTIEGKLFVKYFPLKTVSAQSLKFHIERIQTLEGIRIDEMIVDYADILRPLEKDSNSNSYSEAGGIYEELRQAAGELQIPVWTASQTNRCHFIMDMVETPSGIKPIGNLVEGDNVMTHAGFKRVSKVFPIENQPVYKVKTKSGREINISVEHGVPVSGGGIKSIASGLKCGDKIFTKK